jgi:hypothetical protein
MGGQNGVVFSRGDIQRAVQSATARHQRGQLVQGLGNNRWYPRVYHYDPQNWALFAMSPLVNVNQNFVEYPLFQGATYRGGYQGPDRVIIDATTGEFAGVLTHRGVPNNGFRPCFGGGQPPVPIVAPYALPVLNPTLNPVLLGYAGLGGGSGLSNTTAKARNIIEIRERVVEIQA